MPAKIFYSYSHADEELRVQLERHLAVLQRSGWITGWHDRSITAGSEWRGTIDEHLRDADIILLLISADFLASDYCYDVELKIAMERHDRGEAVVIPVILRPVVWASAPFGRLQALPRDGRPITTWPNRDEAFAQVAASIRDLINRRFRHQVPGHRQIADPVAPTNADRVLDAAMPRRVTVGKPAELLAMVRRTESAGLRAIVTVEDDTDIEPEDVRSRSFSVEFPLDAGGHPLPATVTLRIDAPCFEPPVQEKQIRVPVEGDSQVCGFLLVPKQTGELLVILELLVTNVQQASRTLKTRAEALVSHEPIRYSLLSMPLLTLSSGGTLAYAVAGAQVASPMYEDPRRTTREEPGRMLERQAREEQERDSFPAAAPSVNEAAPEAEQLAILQRHLREDAERRAAEEKFRVAAERKAKEEAQRRAAELTAHSERNREARQHTAKRGPGEKADATAVAPPAAAPGRARKSQLPFVLSTAFVVVLMVAGTSVLFQTWRTGERIRRTSQPPGAQVPPPGNAQTAHTDTARPAQPRQETERPAQQAARSTAPDRPRGRAVGDPGVVINAPQGEWHGRMNGKLAWSGRLPPGGRVVVSTRRVIRGPGKLTRIDLLPGFTKVEITGIEPAGKIKVTANGPNALTIANVSDDLVNFAAVTWRVKP